MGLFPRRAGEMRLKTGMGPAWCPAGSTVRSWPLGKAGLLNNAATTPSLACLPAMYSCQLLRPASVTTSQQ